MEIIATTKDGVIISATNNEVNSILQSVMGFGKNPKTLEIGQKIPAIDYATTIIKVKGLNDSYEFKQIKNNLDAFNKHFQELKQTVESAVSIEKDLF